MKVDINISTQHSHNMHGSLVYTLLHIHGSYIVVISLAIDSKYYVHKWCFI